MDKILPKTEQLLVQSLFYNTNNFLELTMKHTNGTKEKKNMDYYKKCASS